jgi:hypothetical protein
MIPRTCTRNCKKGAGNYQVDVSKYQGYWVVTLAKISSDRDKNPNSELALNLENFKSHDAILEFKMYLDKFCISCAKMAH